MLKLLISFFINEVKPKLKPNFNSTIRSHFSSNFFPFELFLLGCMLILHSTNSFAYNCANIWSEGFPINSYKSSFPCVEYSSIDIPSGTTRIYYAEGLKTSEVKSLMELIKQAVIDSHKTYSSLGGIRPSAIIYTGLKSAKNRNAEVPFEFGTDSEPVPMIIYNNLLTEPSIEFQKQTIAHEYFHIFQKTNFSKSWGKDASSWWVEGSADFFSNLVYPTYNREWLNAETYDSDKALFNQDPPYSPNVFFQSLAQSWGGSDLVTTLLSHQDTISNPGTLDGQWNGLSRFPSIGLHFSNFAQQYTLSAVKDSGGGNVTTHFVDPIPIAVTEPGINEEIEVLPFKINSKRWSLPPGYTWELEAISSGEESSEINMRREGPDRQWQIFFPGYTYKWDLSCKDEPQILSVLATNGASSTAPISKVNIAIKPIKKECECKTLPKLEPAFVGVWRFEHESFKQFLQKSVGENIKILEISGNAFIKIKTDKTFQYILESVIVKALTDEDRILMTIQANGDATSGKIESSSTSSFCLKNISSSLSARVTLEASGVSPAEGELPIDFSLEEKSFKSTIIDGQLKIKHEFTNEAEPMDLIFEKQ